MLTIKPLHDKILVQRIGEETSVGGIIIPDTAKEKPQKGKIIRVGSGKSTKSGKKIKPVVKEGDIVLFGKYSGDEWSIGNEEYLFLTEDEILAIL